MPLLTRPAAYAFHLQLAAKLAAPGPAWNVSLNYSCSTGTWIAVDAAGRLAPVGWRKYTEASALRWAVDHLTALADVAQASASAAAAFVLAPPNSTVTAFAANVTFPSVRASTMWDGLFSVRSFDTY